MSQAPTPDSFLVMGDTPGKTTIDSWEALRHVVRERWATMVDVVEDEASIAVGSGSRSLRIDRVDVAAFPAHRFVSIRFVICSRDHLAEPSALRINADLAVGKVVLSDDVYELQHVLDLTSVNADQLEYRLGFLAKLVAALRDVHGTRPATDADAYSMFAD